MRADIARRKRIERSLAAEPLARRGEPTLGDRYLDAAMRHMRGNLASALTVRSVADALCISESYLSKLFKRKVGRPFLDVLTQVRMEEAARLLRTTNMRVYEIADALGYRDAEYFSGLFRKFAGVTPSEYKRQR